MASQFEGGYNLAVNRFYVFRKAKSRFQKARNSGRRLPESEPACRVSCPPALGRFESDRCGFFYRRRRGVVLKSIQCVNEYLPRHRPRLSAGY